jgi:hypothetical protein
MALTDNQCTAFLATPLNGLAVAFFEDAVDAAAVRAAIEMQWRSAGTTFLAPPRRRKRSTECCAAVPDHCRVQS